MRRGEKSKTEAEQTSAVAQTGYIYMSFFFSMLLNNDSQRNTFHLTLNASYTVNIFSFPLISCIHPVLYLFT